VTEDGGEGINVELKANELILVAQVSQREVQGYSRTS
jgi:hypothetical protein